MNIVSIKQGDCLELIKEIQDGSIDCILCDLPYGKETGKTRASWDKGLNYDELFAEYRRILSPKGTIILFGNEPFSSRVRCALMDMYKYDIKWIKSKTTGFANANYRPMNKYEDIMVFSNCNASSGGKNNAMVYNPQGLIVCDKKRKNSANRQGIVAKDTNNLGKENSLLQEGSEYTQKYTNYPTNVIYFDNESHYVHPTQKPLTLIEYLVLTYTDENQLVLDTCMGSGTTGVACINNNRQFIGFELDADYFSTAEDRIQKARMQLINAKSNK